MSLAPGTRLGPFEILASLGAGGQGEVYRARDPRLGRDVAVKILPAERTADAESIQRFEQEARAVAALSHPNIVSLFEVGRENGASYLVTELLDGETLRQRLQRGPLPPRKAIEITIHVAEGLAAAHGRGIAHRDVKPENLFITRDGRIKILDFGLARTTGEKERADIASTLEQHTASGTVLGTVGYMAPEQVRGERADGRADIFALGAILHEMLSGQRAFRRDTPLETALAIIKEDPPSLSGVDPGLERVVLRCLEKDPNERFQSARDVAFALEALSGRSTPAEGADSAALRRRWPRGSVVLTGVACLAAGAVALALIRPAAAPADHALHHRVTFRRGAIHSARFTPDGQSVVYGAAWNDQPFAVFATRIGMPESRTLGHTDATPLAISATGEMAMLVHMRKTAPFAAPTLGTLASVPLEGGAPREVLENVTEADWSPDGAGLAAIHAVQVRSTLFEWEIQFPPGHVIFRGRVHSLRFSPDGELLAFVRTADSLRTKGTITVVDRGGHDVRTIGGLWDVRGLAWSPSGKEILFVGEREGDPLALRGVTLSGRERVLLRMAGAMRLHDVSATGRLLVARESITHEIKIREGDGPERDLSWLDSSVPSEVSADGAQLLFGENGDAFDDDTAYVRRLDGSPPVRLGDGWPVYWTGDGRSILVERARSPELVLVPVGAGTPKPAPTVEGLAAISSFNWSVDGKHMVLSGNEPGRQERVWIQSLPDGRPRPITAEGELAEVIFSPDGTRIAIPLPGGALRIAPLEGGAAVDGPRLDPEENPVTWSADGTALYVASPSIQTVPARLRIALVDLATGQRKPWRAIIPEDPTGVTYIMIPGNGVTADGRIAVYGLRRSLSDLYITEGLPLE